LSKATSKALHFSFLSTFAKIVKVMVKEYTKKEFWNIYEKLPDELQEAIFSPETADHIKQACERSGVDQNSEVARLTGQVLMGLLTPKEFKKTLREDLELTQEQVKSLYREINRFILLPVRETLSALYGVAIKPTKKPQRVEGSREGSQEKEKNTDDRYREPIE